MGRQDREWNPWIERKCPNCKSDNVEEIEYVSKLDNIVVGQMHCRNCGFKGTPYLY